MVGVIRFIHSVPLALDYPGPGVMLLATLATFAFILIGGWLMYRADMRYRAERDRGLAAQKAAQMQASAVAGASAATSDGTSAESSTSPESSTSNSGPSTPQP